MTFIKSLFLVFALSFTLTSYAQLDHIQPPFWWAGMKHSEIQVLFHGDNIADYQVSLRENIPITGVIRTENPNYLFVSIETKGVKPGNIHLLFSKNGKTAFTHTYSLKKRRKNSALREGFDSSDVIYLLMPDRFANGNLKNDAVPNMTEGVNRDNPGGRHGGDIQGIIDHLDYLEDLGVTAIWSTPLLKDNDSVYSYHQYAQSDVYHIDPRFGSNKLYRQLAKELHQRDMKLIMDYVTNHWGRQGWIFQDLPSYDWVHQFPGYAQSNYRMETQFDPHRSNRDFKYCVDGWFVKTMPDLNQSNPLVLDYLIQNAIWWIEYANLDGFRVDTYSYNDKAGIAKWTKAVMTEYPNFNIVGEVWMHDQAQIAYWQKDSKIGAIQSYNSHLPSVMDFTLHDAIGQMFKEKASWNTGMIRAYNNFVNDFLYPNPSNLLVFMENHDTNRFNEIYDQNFDAYRLGLSLILTTRGIPQLYYGSEIGMRGKKSNGDGDIRRDFPGGWPDDNHNAFSESGRTALQNKFFNFTKKLLNWRQSAEVIHQGKLLQYLPHHNVYVYFRYLENDRVMVILNNSDTSQTLKLSRYTQGLAGATAGIDIITGEAIRLKNHIKISANTPMIIELN